MPKTGRTEYKKSMIENCHGVCKKNWISERAAQHTRRQFSPSQHRISPSHESDIGPPTPPGALRFEKYAFQNPDVLGV
jgi:hypothetical protein